VAVAGHDLAAAPVEAKRQLAFLPDEPRLFDYLTVREHLQLVARLYGVEGWEDRGAALLEELELGGKQDALPGELSRGMKQKLTIACGFLHDPRLIVLDEPLTGLDPLAIRKMKQSLRARAAAGAAIILSSHLLPLVEELCHRVLVVAGGRMVAHGTLEEIRATLAGAAGDSLEDLFIRITTAGEAGAPPPLPTVPAPGR
jgi:ABC-2 type transport system ATP-binding protein